VRKSQNLFSEELNMGICSSTGGPGNSTPILEEPEEIQEKTPEKLIQEKTPEKLIQEKTPENFLVIGAGPTGLLFALEILEEASKLRATDPTFTIPVVNVRDVRGGLSNKDPALMSVFESLHAMIGKGAREQDDGQWKYDEQDQYEIVDVSETYVTLKKLLCSGHRQAREEIHISFKEFYKNWDLLGAHPFYRRSVIRGAFQVSKYLPRELIERMWCDDGVADKIFGMQQKIEHDYDAMPTFSVQLFQRRTAEYLKRHYPDNFNLYLGPRQVIPNYPVDEGTIGVICAAGWSQGSKMRIREEKECPQGLDQLTKWDVGTKYGLLLQYRRVFQGKKFNETFDEHSWRTLSKEGMTYGASNDEEKNVQLYVFSDAPSFLMYPLFEEAQDCKKFREILSSQARITNSSTDKHTLLTSPPNSCQDADYVRWLGQVKQTLRDYLVKRNFVPETFDMGSINLFMAARSSAAYHKVQGRLSFNQVGVKEMRETPVVFLGDAAGGTDYKKGLSGSRGQVACVKFVKYMMESLQECKTHTWTVAQEKAMSLYQEYWDGVLESEFGEHVKNAHTFTNHCYYKYGMEGRQLKTDGWHQSLDTGTVLDLVGKEGFNRILRMLSRDEGPEEYKSTKDLLVRHVSMSPNTETIDASQSMHEPPATST